MRNYFPFIKRSSLIILIISSERPSHNKSEFKIPTDLRVSRNNEQQNPVEKESQSFECRYCEEEFEDIISATSHIKKKHIEKLSQNYEHKDLMSCLVLPKVRIVNKLKYGFYVVFNVR